MRNTLKRDVVFVLGTDPQDGVMQYANQISIRFKKHERSSQIECKAVNFSKLWCGVKCLFDVFRHGKLLHMQYPMIGSWGKSIWPGIVPAVMRCALALKRPKLVLTLHEWGDMHLLRKVSIFPLLMMADEIIFVSNMEYKKMNSTFTGIFCLNRKKQRVIPIGINLEIPSLDVLTVKRMRSELLDSTDESDAVIIGYFGFMYASKKPHVIVDVVEALVHMGLPAKALFIGDFTKHATKDKIDFLRYIQQRDMDAYVNITGYINDEVKVSEMMRACNVVILPFVGGLTARRGSFWYALALGVPLISTQPSEAGEFANGFLEGLASENVLRLVREPVDVPAVAKMVAAEFSSYRAPKCTQRTEPSWVDIVEEHISLYRE